MIEAVVFDLDDTLHDDTRAYRAAAAEVAAEIAAQHGVAAEPLVAAFVSEMQAFWRALGPDHLGLVIAETRIELWSGALRSVGVDDEAVAREAAGRYSDYRKKYYAPFPGALDLLAHLRARGMKLGLITNGFAATHREKIVLLGLERSFDAVLIADEVGMVKPDPRIFLHACELLGSAPAGTVMVGDRYRRDVAGAKAAGMRTIYIDVHGEPIPPDAPPDVTVSGLDGVLGALDLPGAVPGSP